jgi:hypothetical protein
MDAQCKKRARDYPEQHEQTNQAAKKVKSFPGEPYYYQSKYQMETKHESRYGKPDNDLM